MPEETQQKKTATKTKMLVHAEIILDLYVPYYDGSPEGYAKACERACEDFRAFVHDHRHQDVNGVEVRRIYEDRCSACGEEWETGRWNDDGDDPKEPERCVNCGAIIENQ